MILTGPAGDTIPNAVTAKQQRRARQLRGEADVRRLGLVERPRQREVRLVSPQGFAAGRLANLSPEQS